MFSSVISPHDWIVSNPWLHIQWFIFLPFQIFFWAYLVHFFTFSFQLYLSALEFPPWFFFYTLCVEILSTIFPLNISVIVALKLLSPKSNILAFSVSINYFFWGDHTSHFLYLMTFVWKLNTVGYLCATLKPFINPKNCWDFCSYKQLTCLSHTARSVSLLVSLHSFFRLLAAAAFTCPPPQRPHQPV